MINQRLMVLLGCMALAPLAVQAGDRPDHGERWAALDTDGDGAVSQAEAQAGAPRMAEHFVKLDTDGDGRVTDEEMQAARARHREEMQARGEERYRSADTNGDGSIDLAEAQTSMPRAADRFVDIDADGNGLLTREEMRSAMRAHHGEHQHGGQRRQHDDTDGRGKAGPRSE